MFTKFAVGAVISGLLATGAFAETYEVQMLNRGDAGSMVFEPAFLQVAAGDTVRFVATDRGHNAAAIPEMIPEGVEAFEGGINEEIELVLDVEGLYAVKCTPHFAMGMVMTIAVGDAVEMPAGYLEGRLPPRALERFTEQLGGL